MHVCLIASGRISETLYGEERFTISLRNWLIEHGYDATIIGRKLFGVKVIKSHDSIYIEPETKLTEPRALHLPRPIYILCMLITSLFFTLHIIAINRRSRVSIIHAQDTGYGGLSAIVSAKILRVPAMISSHGVRYFNLAETLTGVFGTLSLVFERWLDGVTSRNTDLINIVACSHTEFFANLGVRKRKITVIPIGIDINKFKLVGEVRQAIRAKLDVQNDVLVGFVGRFFAEKNLFTLLESFAQALRYANKMKLLLVGAGPLEDELRTLCHSRGIDDKVIFTGTRYDVNRLLPALDIFVLPSYSEGCPTALLEAMAAGKAIISSHIPSIKEIVRHDKEAILVNPRSVEELKQAILLLYNDSDLRSKLGHNAGERARFYDINNSCRRILEVYKELIDSARTRVNETLVKNWQ